MLIEPDANPQRNPLKSHGIGQYIRAADKTKEILLKTKTQKTTLEKTLTLFKQ